VAPPLIARAVGATPLTPLSPPDFRGWLSKQKAHVKSWVAENGFSAKPNEICLIPRQAGPGRAGGIERALVGYNADDAHWAFAALPGVLPPGTYRLDDDVPARLATPLALGWELGAYRFARYSKKKSKPPASLVWPAGVDRDAIRRAVEAIFLVRDLINTPASDMGPAQLAEAATGLAKRFAAHCEIIEGDALLARNYPLIHAVGRASAKGPRGSARDRQPRLVDLRWGREGALKVTLVGKGVCFDSGGLNLKTEAGMKLMKKDMGGAAHVLGLALMIMDAKLDVRLRVLIPAVENSVSAESMRPLDVVKSRKGLTVEIGNTDAEGRLILADALTEASREKPAILIDCATLTGAARAALGPDLPALFCNDEALAADILRVAAQETDPVWRLPLWFPYGDGLESSVADISSISESPHGGAITAALFLSEFVEKGTPWAHFDIMAWNVSSRPGRPKGGEAMGLRALFAFIAERAAASPGKAASPSKSGRMPTRRLRRKRRRR
jgi:leucyl aminopeptidase